jgi:hypothetical protein
MKRQPKVRIPPPPPGLIGLLWCLVLFWGVVTILHGMVR